MRVRPVLAAVALAFALAAAARPASADGGTPAASPSARPPSVVLRQLDEPTAPPTTDSGRVPELVVLVGGFGSVNGDRFFDDLTTSLIPHGLVVQRFGTDPSFPYDTLGPIDDSAGTLCDLVRARGREYAAVHIVAHSMGGVVADRALARCLSNGDVATYVSLSAPHSGSAIAERGQTVLAAAGDARTEVAAILGRFGPDLDTGAGRDLVSSRPVDPPVGTVRVDVREATDLIVSTADARDGAIAERTLLSIREGHGGIVSDDAAIDLTARTILERRVPPDDRGALLRGASLAFARFIDLIRGNALELVFLLAFLCALALRTRRLMLDTVLIPFQTHLRRYLAWLG